MMRAFTRGAATGTCMCLAVLLTVAAHAQTIPGPADAGRVRTQQPELVPDRSQDRRVTIPTIVPSAPVPKEAKSIQFVLKDVRIKGATAFSSDALKDIYASYLGKSVTLDIAWMIAGAITERYRNEGYFLSRAYVPAQEIDSGVLTINVVEGYVGQVDIEGEGADSWIVQRYIERLKAERPLKAAQMESFLLHLNDLPGLSFRSVLAPLEGTTEEGAIKLSLLPVEEEDKGSVNIDNYGSRFLGPHQASLSYQRSLLPLQQTSVSLLSSLPAEELKSGTASHAIVVAPDVTLEVNGSMTRAHPGFRLKPLEVESKSASLGVNLSYQWIRQRDKNLMLKLSVDGRNSDSDLLGTELTHDRIRALRAGLSFDMIDDWNGQSVVNLTVSHGLEIFGASEAGDLNLSRAEAVPNFTKLELSLVRLQNLAQNWAVLVSAAGQVASDPLYSSEEFGYGGQSFGRAYDASELTGDHGLNGALELRYNGFAGGEVISLVPYIFYDIGTVWNEDVAQPARASGSSAGLGLRLRHHSGVNASLCLAQPLTKDVDTPLYGLTGKDPRVSFQIGFEF